MCLCMIGILLCIFAVIWCFGIVPTVYFSAALFFFFVQHCVYVSTDRVNFNIQACFWDQKHVKLFYFSLAFHNCLKMLKIGKKPTRIWVCCCFWLHDGISSKQIKTNKQTNWNRFWKLSTPKLRSSCLPMPIKATFD